MIVKLNQRITTAQQNSKELKIKKKGDFLSIKSHYKNQDEAGRFLFYIYYIETNDIEQRRKYLLYNRVQNEAKEYAEYLRTDLFVQLDEIIEGLKK